MRKVIFKSLSIRNFLSVGDSPVVIDFKDGINLITGRNLDKPDAKNGAGKSTIINALYFALFGTTIRELKKDLIVNSINKKNCEVELSMGTWKHKFAENPGWDGPHSWESQNFFLNNYFQLLNIGGVLLCEDMHSSYMHELVKLRDSLHICIFDLRSNYTEDDNDIIALRFNDDIY